VSRLRHRLAAAFARVNQQLYLVLPLQVVLSHRWLDFISESTVSRVEGGVGEFEYFAVHLFVESETFQCFHKPAVEKPCLDKHIHQRRIVNPQNLELFGLVARWCKSSDSASSTEAIVSIAWLNRVT